MERQRQLRRRSADGGLEREGHGRSLRLAERDVEAERLTSLERTFGKRLLPLPDRDVRGVLRSLLDDQAEPELLSLRDERRRDADAQPLGADDCTADVRRMD